MKTGIRPRTLFCGITMGALLMFGGAAADPPSRPVVGHVQIGVLDVQGFCGKAEVASKVRSSASGLRTCYEKRLPQKPNLAGKVTVAWMINLEGRPERARVTNSTLNDQTVENCVARTVGGLEFKKPEGGVCIVQLPVVFEPGK